MTLHGILLPDEEGCIEYLKKHSSNSQNKDSKASNTKGVIYLIDNVKKYHRFLVKSKNGEDINLWEIKYTSPRYIPELMKLAENTYYEFPFEISAKDYDNALKSSAKFAWLFMNICPFKRVSSWD